MNSAVNTIKILIFSVLFISCTKDLTIPNDVEIEASPSFSFPLGTFTHDINGYFQRLYSRNITSPDSLIYDGDLLPNPLPVVEDTETYPFRFSSMTTHFQYVKSVVFKVKVTNEYPSKIEWQLSLANANGLVYGTVPQTPVQVDGATPGENLDAMLPGVQTAWIEFPEDLIQSLKLVRKIQLHYAVSTMENGTSRLKFDPASQIKSEISIQLELELNAGDIQ
jgi:hypothetical protein